MKDLDHNDLELVLGGARRVAASRRSDYMLEYTLQKLASDIKDVADPRNNQQATNMMMLAAAAMMMRSRIA